MSQLPLFIAGFVVSCIVMAAIGILVYSADLDGSNERKQKAERDSNQDQ